MALPGLPLRPPSEAPDLQIRLKDREVFSAILPAFGENLFSSAGGAPSGQPNLRVRVFDNGKYFGFFYGDGARFAVERGGRQVWADWPEGYTLEDACTYLFGPVMGFVLRLRGTVALHASAVAAGERAIALAGLPGAGKSTTAAAFACAGFPVVSDDVVALKDSGTHFLAQPGYPRVNLWPDSVRRLFGSEEALPRITPTWDKRYLQLGNNGRCFASKPLALGAIYILGGRDKTLTAPVVEEISGKQAFLALVANTYVNYLLDQDMRRTEFEVLSRVVYQIPIRRVRAPADLSPSFSLHETIAADARQAMVSVLANATPVCG